MRLERQAKNKNKTGAVMAMEIQLEHHCGTMVMVLQLLQATALREETY